MHGDLGDDLGRRLKEIAQLRAELDVTQLQIINLDSVREAFGDRWPAVRKRVQETSTSFLARRITPEDLLIPCGNGFIIVFGSVEGASAEIAGLQLARALNHFFLGEDGFEHIRLACKHQSLEIAGIANLVRALSAVDQAEAIHGTLGYSADSNATQDLTFKFQPLWDVKHEVISTYVAVACDGHGRPIEIEEYDSIGASPRRGYLARDLAMIEACVYAADAMLMRGEQAIIAMTIHASTLADHMQRREVLEALGTIDPPLRRYLMLILSDVVHGFPRFHLEELVHLLSQKVERISINLSFDEPDFDSIAPLAVWAYGYRVPHMLHVSAETAEALQARLQRDAKRAHKHAKRLLVSLMGPAEMVEWCRAACIDYVASRAVWPLLEAPRGVERSEPPRPAAA
jgi:hypothetical protein